MSIVTSPTSLNTSGSSAATRLASPQIMDKQPRKLRSNNTNTTLINNTSTPNNNKPLQKRNTNNNTIKKVK